MAWQARGGFAGRQSAERDQGQSGDEAGSQGEVHVVVPFFAGSGRTQNAVLDAEFLCLGMSETESGAEGQDGACATDALVGI